MAFLRPQMRSGYPHYRIGLFQVSLILFAFWLQGSADSLTQRSYSVLVNSAVPFSGMENSEPQNRSSIEYQLKAVFLFNFAQFVEWPAVSFPDPRAPFIIGIVGEDPFGTYLDETVRDEKINDHPLLVRRWRRAEEVEGCHILFISQSEQSRLPSILRGVKERKVLTVSDLAGFAQNGGIIEFVTVENKIRLRINAEAAKARELVVSSKLLSLAEVVASARN